MLKVPPLTQFHPGSWGWTSGGERERERIVLKQKDGLSTLEASERHVGEMCVCMFGVSGAYIPSLGR